MRRGLEFLLDDGEVHLRGVHAHHVIALRQIHSVHTTGLPAHRPHFRFAEQNGLAVVAGQENHLLAVGYLRADQFVFAIQVDGDDSGGARIGKFRQPGLFHRSVAGGQEHKTAFLFQIARRNHGSQRLAFLEAHQVADRFSAGGRRRFGNFVHLEPIHPAFGAKQQNVAVRRSHKEMLDEVLFARLRSDPSLAAARLMAVNIHRSPLDVTRVAHGNRHFLVFDQVFDLDFVDAIDDLRSPVVGVIFQDFLQFRDDHRAQFLFAGQNFLQLGDRGLGLFLVALALILTALAQAAMALFLTGTVVGGAAVGAIFLGSLATANRLAPPGRRSQAISALCRSCGWFDA